VSADAGLLVDKVTDKNKLSPFYGPVYLINNVILKLYIQSTLLINIRSFCCISYLLL